MEATYKNKISWEVRDNIGYMRFTDLPQNRMDSVFFKELKMLTARVIPDSNVSALIISGNGRHFSSGADLDELMSLIVAENKDEQVNKLLPNYHSFQLLSEINIPVIAAIKGVCIGSALELALHCHFRLCSEDAILGLPETTFGLMPGVGGIPKLLTLAGKAKTIELVIKGNTFNAEDALNWNIMDAVYPKNILMDKANKLALIAKKDYRKYNKTDYIKLLNVLTEVQGN